MATMVLRLLISQFYYLAIDNRHHAVLALSEAVEVGIQPLDPAPLLLQETMTAAGTVRSPSQKRVCPRLCPSLPR